MKYFGLFLIQICLVFLCNKKQESFQVKNTKWVYNYSDIVADSLIFQDSTYTSYMAELGDWYYGKYYKKNEIIYMQQLGQIIMSNPPEYKSGQINIRGRAIIDSNGALKFLSPEKYENEKWIDTGISFDNSYKFRKLE